MSRLYAINGDTLDTLRTIIYVGDYEKEVVKDTLAGADRAIHRHFVEGGDGLAAIWVTGDSSSLNGMYYIHGDHLGSYDVVTNASGEVVQRTLYNPWGVRSLYEGSVRFARGYTSHEHLDEFGLINMNGRMYDPLSGRFLSPDNFIQLPDNVQSFNRYAYCLNNPLKFTDPSGEILPIIGGAIIAAASYSIQLTGTPGGFSNWNWGQFGKAVAIGAVMGHITSGIGAAVATPLEGEVGAFTTGFVRATGAAFCHGVLGGLSSGLSGGNGVSGFAASSLSSFLGHSLRGLGVNRVAVLAGSVAVGGLGSRMSGGDFCSGAALSAMNILLNLFPHESGSEETEVTKSPDNKSANKPAEQNGQFDCVNAAIIQSSTAVGGVGLLTKGREFIEWEHLRQAKINRELSGDFSRSVKHSLRALKNAGRVSGYVGLSLSGVDIAVRGVNVSNSLDIIMGGVAFVPGVGWVLSGVYFIGNLVWQACSGKTIGESIQSNFADPNAFWKPW